VADSFHFPGALPQAGVKRGAVAGMAGLIVGVADRDGTMEQCQSERERIKAAHHIHRLSQTRNSDSEAQFGCDGNAAFPSGDQE
jgi:hypothetical protein